MADSFYPLTEAVKINNANLAPFEASNILNKAPFLQALATIMASKGTQHEVICETTAPSAGFRAAYDGVENSTSGDTVTTINLKILDSSFAVDKALADSYSKGWEAFVEREAKRHLRQSFFEYESQVIYGTGNDSGGFSGFANQTNLDDSDDAQVVNAGGATAVSSVFLVYSDPEHVAAILGNEGNIQIDESVVQRVAGSATGTFPAYYTPVTAYVGLQIPSIYDVVRICNIDAGSNTLTDDLIAQAIEIFPSDRQPNLMVMSRRSRRQLQNSRTATNPTGAPAPFPTEAFGIPIIPSDAVSNAETALTAA